MLTQFHQRVPFARHQLCCPLLIDHTLRLFISKAWVLRPSSFSPVPMLLCNRCSFSSSFLTTCNWASTLEKENHILTQTGRKNTKNWLGSVNPQAHKRESVRKLELLLILSMNLSNYMQDYGNSLIPTFRCNQVTTLTASHAALQKFLRYTARAHKDIHIFNTKGINRWIP